MLTGKIVLDKAEAKVILYLYQRSDVRKEISVVLVKVP